MTTDAGGGDHDGRERRLLRRLTNPKLSQPTRPKTKDDEELIRLALHQSPFFTCLDEEQVARFVKAAQLKSYNPGEVVILEGYIDDDTKEGDGDKLDTKGLLRKLLSFEKRDVKSDHEQTQPLQPQAPNEAPDEEGEDFLSTIDPGTEMDENQEDEFLHDENDETYAALDAPSPQERKAAVQQLEYLDPTATENYGGIEIDDQAQEEEDATSDNFLSGITSYVYAIRTGSVDVWHGNVNIASYGQGTIFGEGGILFHRQHSATILASDASELECWAVPAKIFRDYVLPSNNMIRMFVKHATHHDEEGNPHMTMDEFVESCLDREDVEDDPSTRVRMANTYNILRKTDGYQKINLVDFCLFHLIMSRPDPEVDIAFLLFDKDRKGTISLDNLAQFLEELQHGNQALFDLNCDFIKRHFGLNGEISIRPYNFSQFLADFQREMGRQAFLHALQTSAEGYLPPKDFVRVLKTACGWRLPEGVVDRLENIYCKAPIEAAEAAAIMSIKAENLKGSSTAQVTKSTTASILANIERRSKLLGGRYFTYGDFLAFQEVLQQLPGICNLVHGACAIKQGPVSSDDFKVANRVIGLGGKLSRRQVDIVFELFDLDHDGFISGEDTASVMGVDFVYKLEATAGREGKLTFAPPPDYRDEMVSEDEDLLHTSGGTEEEEISLSAYITNYLRQLGIGSAAGCVGAIAGFALAPIDLVKTRMQLQRIRPDGVRMYNNTLDCFMRAFRHEGVAGLYRGTLPFLIGIVPQRAFQLTLYSQISRTFEEKDDITGQLFVPLPFQIIAGGVAGACKVLFGNPLDIAQIELQTLGETTRLMKARGRQVPSVSFREIVKELGAVGYYRGASSTLWRDIPFSATFFPCYTATKLLLPTVEGYQSDETHDAFFAAALAAIPAALVTTPADVIKTRLQSAHREGDITYTGVRQCALKIYKHEGASAFFKGAWLRALRAGPQMGLTMAAYEKLSDMWGLNNSKRRMDSRATGGDSSDYRRAYPTRGYGSKAEEIDSLLQHMGMSAPEPSEDENEKK